MSRQMPLVVSHYTVQTGYEQEVKKLLASLDRWKLDCVITPILSRGSWRKNSNYCSINVQQALMEYPDRDILRVDADAIFRQYPDLFLQEHFTADIAAHVHDFPWHRQELLGGTLFFRNKPAVRGLVNMWVELCMMQHPKERNGDLLQKMLLSGRYDVKFAELPAAYCKIFDLMDEVGSPVIEHFQASRRYKDQVNIRGILR